MVCPWTNTFPKKNQLRLLVLSGMREDTWIFMREKNERHLERDDWFLMKNEE
jgi:hypothetical protein